MERIRTILRILCLIGAAWSILCGAAASFLLSNVPLVQGCSLSAAGLILHAGDAYLIAGSLLMVSAIVAAVISLFGLRCARLVRHIDALRTLALAAFGLFLASTIACLVIDEMGGSGWTALIGAALSFSIASLAGEVSRALIAARMLRGAQ